jgi:integrase/recombinase XerD
MSTVTVSPLRQRMIEDMNARNLCAGTQRIHIGSCKQFAGFLKRSPDTATAEDIRRFQLHLSETGARAPLERPAAVLVCGPMATLPAATSSWTAPKSP